jgi:hypothetical protein
MTRARERGQVLVLFALMLVALLGMAALAIDVASVFSVMRTERTVADAAALAGASDMYRGSSTLVGSAEYQNGRTHAMQNLMDQLSPTFIAGDPTFGVLPTCGGVAPPYANDIVNCQVAGTPYYVSVKAPAPSCAAGSCDPVRSVQVTVRTPRYGLTFARLFAQVEWNVAITSVAERNRGTNYSFVTLRPPKPSRANSAWCTPNCDANDENILLDGNNTQLIVRGDMGTNTNMKLTAGATVTLVDPGSFVDRYDAYKLWSGPPPDRQISTWIPDPNYVIPARPTAAALVYADIAAAHLSAADCTTLVGSDIPASYAVSAAGIGTGEVVCLKPGLYQYAPGGSGYAGVTTIILSPGVYFFDQGFMPGNNVRVIGGYEAGSAGVAVVFRDGGACPFPGNCDFAGNSVDLLALNAGDAYPNGNIGTPATAAVNWDGALVQTNQAVPIPMTLIVERDPTCVVAATDTNPCGTASNQNHQLSLPGSGSIHVFGVQYAPTDNVNISGGSGSNGFLGQMWTWTVQYTGGSTVNLVGAQNPEPGVLRIATPCSPGTACTNPEATVTIP